MDQNLSNLDLQLLTATTTTGAAIMVWSMVGFSPYTCMP